MPKNFNAFVAIEFDEKVCLELYKNMKQLGRITIRDKGDTLAAGVVSEFIESI